MPQRADESAEEYRVRQQTPLVGALKSSPQPPKAADKQAFLPDKSEPDDGPLMDRVERLEQVVTVIQDVLRKHHAGMARSLDSDSA